MIYLWHRRYRKILKSMEDFGQPMTVGMIREASCYQHDKYRPLVLRFRDWAQNNNHITSTVEVLGPGSTRIWYSITPQPNDSQ